MDGPVCIFTRLAPRRSGRTFPEQMLPRDQIADAVEIQHRSYQLLMWLGRAIDSGVITFTRAHSDADAANNAYEWIQEHYDLLPEEFRPPRDRLRPFSNYFGS